MEGCVQRVVLRKEAVYGYVKGLNEHQILNINNKYQMLHATYRIQNSFFKGHFNRRGTAFHTPSYHGVNTDLGGDPVI